jgi:phospholipid-binding lipoprotein MlaA
MSRRIGAFAVLALLLGLMTGCATTGAGGERSGSQRVDPWENWNRKVYSFNDKLDEVVLKPVATTYTKVVPQPVRRGLTNFVGNVSDVWSALNNLLQGKIDEGFQDVMRVGTNTLFGLGGFLDVASELGLDRHGEDFGQTLGVWGMAPGPYVIWPFLGPSTLRDSLALPLDRSVSPALFISNDVASYSFTALQLVNERANLLGATGMLDDIALDKYTFVRDAYLQRRRSLVYDGEVPEQKEDRDDEGDAPPAARPAADKPGVDKPAADKPAGDKPAGGKAPETPPPKPPAAAAAPASGASQPRQ